MMTKHHLWLFASTCVGRRDDYALQQSNGRYLRVGRPLDYEALRFHLAGVHTIGTYVTDERGYCHFAVFDADEVGILPLLDLQRVLASLGIASYLELSRRGGHLWVFLACALSPTHLRAWLLPYCPAQVEFYPKRDWADRVQPGSLMRLPFGVHRRSGRRYPFVTLIGSRLVPVASSLAGALPWLATIERAALPPDIVFTQSDPAPTTTHQFSTKKGGMTSRPAPSMTIRDWCLQQDPIAVIGRYIDLNARGMGRCPFGAQHVKGGDRHPSLWVHRPRALSQACWYCNTCKQGGSLFEFLSLYSGLSKKELWHRILSGEHF